MYQHVLIYRTWCLLIGMESKQRVEVLLISTTLLASDAITKHSILKITHSVLKADFAVLTFRTKGIFRAQQM